MNQVQDLPEVVQPRLNGGGARRRAWTRPLALAGVGVLIFVCGGVAGYALSVQSLKKEMSERRDPIKVRPEIITYWKEHLSLNDVQSEEMNEILKAHFARISELRKSVVPEIERENDALRDKVSTILEPEQREAWLKRWEQIREMFRRGPGPGGPSRHHWHRNGGSASHGPNGKKPFADQDGQPRTEKKPEHRAPPTSSP